MPDTTRGVFVVRPHAHDGALRERFSLGEELVSDAVPDV